MARLTKLIVCAMVLGGALALLGACAWRVRPTGKPEAAPLSASTVVPTSVPISASLPGPTTWVQQSGELLSPTSAAGDPGPSATDVAMPAAAGETGITAVTVRSLAPDLAPSIGLTGVLSSGVAPLRTGISRPACGRNGRDLNCDLGDLQAGDAATVTLDLSISGAETLITGTVSSMGGTAIPTTTDLVVQAGGPSTVLAEQPVTYTYTITNRGQLAATGVQFEDVIPSDMDLVAYAPGLPDCEQQGAALTCILPNPDGGEPVSFTLVITGFGEQPMIVRLDPLLPGWPMCTVLKERTWLHIVQCELGDLKPGRATRVQLVLTAIGVVERTTANTASVRANEVDLHPGDNTITTTITIQTGSAAGGD